MVKVFELDDQGKLYIVFCLLGNIVKILCCFWRAVLNGKIWYSYVHPLVLNALRFLLEHQWMFSPFAVVVCESLSCPQWQRWISKCIFEPFLEMVQICRCYKTKECAGPREFFWSGEFNCSGQTRDYHKTFKINDHPDKSTVLRFKGTLKNKGA